MFLLIKKYRDLLYLFSFVSIIVLFLYGIFMFDRVPFVFDVDTILSYNAFYHEWLRLVRDFISGDGYPFYSFNLLLGEDFYSSLSIFVIGDVFLPVLLLFDDIEMGLLVEVILCIYISVFSMYFYLKIYGIKDRWVKIFISLLYGFCTCSILYNGHYMFMRFYAFVPIVFYGIEKYLLDKKAYSFIIGIVLCCFSCFYFMFHTSIFIFLYGLFTTINKKYQVKDIINKAMVLFFYFIIGVLISGIILVPSINVIINSSRFDSYSYSWFYDIGVYYSLFTNFISQYKMFVNTHYYQSWYSLFVGAFVFSSCLSLFFDKKYWCYRWFLLVLFVILGLPIFGSLMHGFSYPSFRWTHLLVFYLFLMGAVGLDNYDCKRVLKGFLIYFSLFVLFSLFMDLFTNYKFEYNLYYVVIFGFASSIIVFIGYYNKYIGLIFSLLYTIISAYYYFDNGLYKEMTFNEPFSSEQIDKFAFNQDSLLFRYYIHKQHFSPNVDFNLNSQVRYGFMGTMGYHTLYDHNIDGLVSYRMDGFNESHKIEFNNPYLLNMLGSKYFVVYHKGELPKELEFEFIENLNHLMIYENLSYKGFGFTYSDMDYFDVVDIDNISDILYIDDSSFDLSLYQQLEYHQFNIHHLGNNYLWGDIELNSDNILMIPIPNNNGWDIFVDGELVKPISVNGGLIGIELTKGYHDIEMYFVSYGLKVGIVLSIIGVCLFIGCIIYDKNKK